MIKIWTLSDIHDDVGEGYQIPAKFPDCDVIVVTGDLRERLSQRALPRLVELFGGAQKPLIYVPGNHCFYKTALHKEKIRARDVAANLGVHLLQDGESTIISGTRFIGGTLWTDFAIHGDEVQSMAIAEGAMNDYRRIRALNGEFRLRPHHLKTEHENTLRAIAEELRKPFRGNSVVVTHHAPHPCSLREHKVVEPLDAAYASDLSRLLIAEYAPKLWIHGHVHANRDYRVGRTRIVSNPHGYVFRNRLGRNSFIDRENPSFIPDLVLEV